MQLIGIELLFLTYINKKEQQLIQKKKKNKKLSGIRKNKNENFRNNYVLNIVDS